MRVRTACPSGPSRASARPPWAVRARAESGYVEGEKDTIVVAPLGATHVHARALFLEVLPALTAAG